MSESGFKRLLDIGDAQIRKELEDDYYFISKNRMDNFIYCLEEGSKQIQNQKVELDRLTAELAEANNYKEASRKVILELEAELSRYRNGVEVEGTYGDNLMLQIKNELKELIGQRVKVLVMPCEKEDA